MKKDFLDTPFNKHYSLYLAVSGIYGIAMILSSWVSMASISFWRRWLYNLMCHNTIIIHQPRGWPITLKPLLTAFLLPIALSSTILLWLAPNIRDEKNIRNIFKMSLSILASTHYVFYIVSIPFRWYKIKVIFAPIFCMILSC